MAKGKDAKATALPALQITRDKAMKEIKDYSETYRHIATLRDLVLQYSGFEYHGRHPNILWFKRKQIRHYCNKIIKQFPVKADDKQSGGEK